MDILGTGAVDSKRKREASSNPDKADESRKQHIRDDYINKLSLQYLLKKYDLPLQQGTFSDGRLQQLETKAAAWIIQRIAEIENPTNSTSSVVQREEVDNILVAIRRIGILNRNASRPPLKAKLFTCCWTYKIHIKLPLLFHQAVNEVQKTLATMEPQREAVLDLLVRMKRLFDAMNKERELIELPARDLVLMWLEKIERDLFTHRDSCRTRCVNLAVYKFLWMP